MKDFSKATPRPWQQNFLGSFIETSDKTICEMSVNENDANFSYDEYKQNGDLIVTAVNNFEKMKEALIFLTDIIGEHRESIWLNDYDCHKFEGIKQLLESIK